MTDTPDPYGELIEAPDSCPLCHGTGKFQGDFASKMLLLRKQKGLSQKEAASLLGVSRPNLCNIETGRVSPHGKLLISAARVYGASADWLLGIDGEKP